MLFSRSLQSLKGRASAVLSAAKASFAVKATGVDVVSPLLGLTEDQREFYGLARSFADNELRPHAQKWDEESHFPLDTYKQFGDLGFGGIFVKDDVDGSALSRVDSSVIVEALSTGCVGTTAMLTIHNMCAGMIDKFGSEAQRQKWLPSMCAMETKASYCLTEPGSGSDAGSLTTSAKLDAATGEYVINGSKAFISGAGMSDLYVVMCRTPDHDNGVSCFLVPNGTPGLSFGSDEKKMGWNCQPTRQVIFEDVRVSAADNMLGPQGHGFKMAMMGLDGGRLSIGSCSLGAAQICFELSLAYVKERKQFGKPIAQNQAVQFMLADMAGKIVTSRGILRSAAALLDAGDPAATAHCAMAKKISTEACLEVCNEALQLHGGYGYLKDYQIERYVRDLRVHQILEGTNQIMRHIIGRSIVS